MRTKSVDPRFEEGRAIPAQFGSSSGPVPARGWLVHLAVCAVGILLLAPPLHAGVLNLSWNAPTTNADGSALTDLSTYQVYVGTSSSPCPGTAYQVVPSQKSAPSPGDVVTSQVTGLVTGTNYVVQVTAVDSSGAQSACSAQATALAHADSLDTSPPSISSSSLTITGSAPAGATYTSWTAVTVGLSATDNVGVTGYYLPNPPTSTPPAASAAGWVAVTPTLSYSNSVPYTLSSGDGSKSLYAWYKDAAGNVSATASASILLDQTPPSGGTLTATAGSGQVGLTWAGFTDGGSGLATTNPYKLVVNTGSSPAATCTSGTQLYQGTGTSYTHTGLTSGTPYYYRVCATDKAGNISAGATVSATPQAADTTPPTVSITSPTTNLTYSTSTSPLTFAGTASDNVGVTTVTWTNSLGGSGTASGTTSWSASGIALQGGTNVLTVSAKDAAGNTGTATLTVTYTPPDTTAPTAPGTVTATATGSSQISLSWSASTDNVGVTGYRVERCQGVGCSSFTQIATSPGTSYGDSGLLASTSYSYRVRATDAAGNLSPYSSTASATTQAAAAPAGLATDAIASSDLGSPRTSLNTTIATRSPNELLLVFVATSSVGGRNSIVTRVSGGNLTWTLVQRTNVQSGSTEIWRAFARRPLNNLNVKVTFSQAVVSSLTVMSFTGVDPLGTNGSGAIGAIGSGNASQGSPTATLTTRRNNSWVLGVGNDGANPTARTPGANQNLVHQQLTPVGTTHWVQQMNTSTPIAGTTVTLYDAAPSGDPYNLTIVEVLPALGQ